ncbi:MAG: hypothetical protein E7614_02520 [Ruminococcaceae bacterium]|nr:hypothetical protein [Oscillospiraceae bacterium]
MKNNQKIPLPLFILALVCANGGIIICLMHLVFHFIDSVNFAVGFLDNKFTFIVMLIASILSALASVSVMIILNRRESKSYFFRKVAFINFWICVINILLQRNVILPNMIETVTRNMIWFFVSMFTILTCVFCDGLLVMEENEEE